MTQSQAREWARATTEGKLKWKDPHSGGMERGSTKRSSRWRVPVVQGFEQQGGISKPISVTALSIIGRFPVANMNGPFSGPLYSGAGRAI